MHECLHVRDHIFLPHSYVFVLKLRESLLKSLHIEVPENY